MRNKSVWLLLAVMACTKSGGVTTTTTTAGTPGAADSVDASKDTTAAGKAAAEGKFQHPVKKAPIVDTGVVAPPQALVRETYGYSFTSASRDPFRPLTIVAVEGPELPDMQLMNLIFNPTDPKLSLVTFMDKGNKKRYTVRPGDRIGRLLVVSVDTASAILRVNDFGTIREQTYLLRKEDGN